MVMCSTVAWQYASDAACLQLSSSLAMSLVAVSGGHARLFYNNVDRQDESGGIRHINGIRVGERVRKHSGKRQ